MPSIPQKAPQQPVAVPFPTYITLLQYYFRHAMSRRCGNDNWHGLLRRDSGCDNNSSCQKQIISHSHILKNSRRVTTQREPSILFAINELRYLTILAATTVPSAFTALTT